MSTPQDDRPRAERIPAALRAEQIYEAAQQVALERGLAGVTLRAVAERAGVASALVAHYAPSMSELVADTFRAVAGRELAEVRAHVLAVRDPVARLRTLLTTMLDGTRNDVTPIWVDAWGLGRRNGDLADAITEEMNEWHAAIVEVLEAGISSGAMTPADTDLIAAQVLAMIDGLNAHEMVDYGRGASSLRLIGRALELELGLPDGALGQ